jgi:hypothetical protein
MSEVKQLSAEHFDQPTVVDDVTFAFGGDVRNLMPPYEAIPDEFKRDSNPYVRFQRDWFYGGIPKDRMPAAKPGIDFKTAMRHLGTIQGSFEPKHEHKEAAVAYLASKWLLLSSDSSLGEKP